MNKASELVPPVLGLATIWLAVAGGGVLAGVTQAAAVLLSLTWLLTQWRRPADEAFSPAAWAGIAILGFLVLTAIPVPVRWTAWHGSLRYGQNLAALERFELAAALGLVANPPKNFAVSRNLGGTLRIVVLVASCLSAAMLAAGMDRGQRRFYLRFLALLGVLVAVGGYLGQYRFPQGNTLWWRIAVPPMLPGPVACFANRNHFAGFLALLSVPVLVMARHDLAARRHWAAIAMLTAAGIMVAVLVLTPSRGAWVAWAAGIIVVFSADLALSLIRRRADTGPATWRFRIAFVALVPLVALILVAGTLRVASPVVRGRLEELLHRPWKASSMVLRREAWAGTLRVWRHYPLAGAGANALRMVYPQHRLSTHRKGRTHASNQYLQILVETGVVGTLLAAFLVFVWLRAGLRRSGTPIPGAMRSRDGFGLVAGSAMAVAAVHAMVEFPHNVPLYGVVMATLAGIGLPLTDSAPPQSHSQPKGSKLPVPALICLVTVAFTLPAWRAMHRRDDPQAVARAETTELMHILSWSPTSWQAWCEFGLRGCAAGRWATYRWGEETISLAAALDPNNYLLWQTLGKVRLGMGDNKGAREAFGRVSELRPWVRIPHITD